MTIKATTMITSHEINLHYKEGKSDKVYNVWVERAGGAYTVKFSYGRRGSTLNYGTKVESTDSWSAWKAYNKIIAEKIGKGYQLEGGVLPKNEAEFKSLEEVAATVTTTSTVIVPVVSTSEHGLIPQLLNEVRDYEPYLVDKFWCMQEKFDGRRQILQMLNGEVTGWNKTGKKIEVDPRYCSVLQKAFRGYNFTLDGEACGDFFWAFDIISLEDQSLREKPYEDRLLELGMLMRSIERQDPLTIILAPTAYTRNEKEGMVAAIKARGGEGIVIKKLDAKYTSGRPNSGGSAFKYKFVASAACRVIRVNEKRSVEVGVEDRMKGRLIPMGNVTIPVNHEIPKEGDLVEVRYLYAYPGGSFFQPVYLGKRDDAELDEIGTIKFKMP